ncbi:MAG: hypothetical protein HQL71_11155 [Magnetococcales bacterium]|nr:hypothetical protein [Magnetococcales bacterium]
MSWKQYYCATLLSLSLCFVVPSFVFAHSFGNVVVTSSLGQPFAASIPLTLRADEISQGAYVTIALPADYKVMELERAIAVSSLSIKMIGKDVKRVIQISSLKPFNEPFFNLLLKTSVGRGSYYRNFKVFLDIIPQRHIPLFEDTQQSQQTVNSVKNPIPKSVAPAKVIEQPDEPLYEEKEQLGGYGNRIIYPVFEADTPSEALKPRKTITANQVVASTDLSNSSNLKSSSSIAAKKLPVMAALPMANIKDKTYGPVGWDESLSGIVRKLRGSDSRWTMSQVAVALWEKNRSGFYHDNMSGLMAGTVLLVPNPDEIAANSPKAAFDEFKRQWAEWKAIKSGKYQTNKKLSLPPFEVVNAIPQEVVGGSELKQLPQKIDPEQVAVALNLTIKPDVALKNSVNGDDEQGFLKSIDGVVVSHEKKLKEDVVEQKNYEKELALALQELDQVGSKVTNLTTLVSKLTSNITKLTSQLERSEASRAQLNKRFVQLESTISNKNQGNTGIDHNLLTAGAGGLVATLLGVLFWLRRRQQDALLTSESAVFEKVVDNIEPPVTKDSQEPKTDKPLDNVDELNSSKEQKDADPTSNKADSDSINIANEQSSIELSNTSDLQESEQHQYNTDEVIEFVSESANSTPTSFDLLDDAPPIEQVEFVPVKPVDVSSISDEGLPGSEEIETIEFDPNKAKSPQVNDTDNIGVAINVEDTGEAEEFVLEIDSGNLKDDEVVKPASVAKNREDDELFIEIGYDLEDPTDSATKK